MILINYTLFVNGDDDFLFYKTYWKAPDVALMAASAQSTSIWASAFCLSSFADPKRRCASDSASWAAWNEITNVQQYDWLENFRFTLGSRFSTSVASSANNWTLESGWTATEPLLTKDRILCQSSKQSLHLPKYRLVFPSVSYTETTPGLRTPRMGTWWAKTNRECSNGSVWCLSRSFTENTHVSADCGNINLSNIFGLIEKNLCKFDWMTIFSSKKAIYFRRWSESEHHICSWSWCRCWCRWSRLCTSGH